MGGNNKKGKEILTQGTLIIVGSYFFFLGLARTQNILGPLVIAVILALVVLPLSQRIEKRGMKRGYASLINVFLIFLVSLAFLALVSFQVKSFVDDWPQIKEQMAPRIDQLKAFALEHTPLEQSDLQSSGEGGSSLLPSAGSSSGQTAMSILSAIFGFIGNYLLTFIYIFFLLTYRRRFKEFLLSLFRQEKKDGVSEVIYQSANVVQQYLVGKLILMGLLAVVYSIGLGLSGVSNFILVGLIAAVLSLIPYIGNIIGFVLAISLGFLTSGEVGVLIGVVATFTVTQFVESYIFQPYIVGDKVDVHPFFVILVVIIGNAIWGVAGMILAIPLMGMITIIFLHVEALHPYGYLFSSKSYSKKNNH
ncbi:MAG: AI-2E family transporter [Bacteroidales bacterium]